MSPDDLVGPFERLLADLSPPEKLRAIEAGGDPAPLWAALSDSGFLDALVPEDAGGAGLTLGDIVPLLIALGRNPTALPVADTIVARGLLAAGGHESPSGPIVLATLAPRLPWPDAPPATADHILADTGEALVLLTPAEPTREAGTPGIGLPRPRDGLRPTAAVLRAAEIAGLADAVLAMTIGHANQREQFGKPIGKQQAVQQQLAVMAEKGVLARIAAQLGCAGGLPVATAAAAIAKQVTGAAAIEIAAIAHAVHGAIGIAAEHDLQLFTRRLHRARLADGAESYWSRLLGQQRLASPALSSLDFARSIASAGVAP